jgi:hypothetical protein
VRKPTVIGPPRKRAEISYIPCKKELKAGFVHPEETEA